MKIKCLDSFAELLIRQCLLLTIFLPQKREKGHGVFQQRGNIETALNFLKKKSVRAPVFGEKGGMAIQNISHNYTEVMKRCYHVDLFHVDDQ